MKRLTIRARLTLVYGGLFFVAGLLLLGVTYVLVSQRRPDPTETITVMPSPSPGQAPVDDRSTLVTGAKDGWQDALDALAAQGGIALVIVSAIASVLGWLIAGRLLQPMHRVTDTARRIAEAPAADRVLHERIALDGPHDEIKELADTFDVMLSRLDHSFDGQRRFIANASHELRTPLAVNRALLEVALYRQQPSPDTSRLGETLLEINSRHERLLDGLLLLARSERDVGERSYVDLADIAEHVIAQAPAGAVTIRGAAQEAPVSGNPILLERLVQNLVDNGVRHNIDEGGWIMVATGPGLDGTVTVRVTNTGPVVPKYEIPALFEPFHRLGNTRLFPQSPGAGLGLSIVRAIARAHGGNVSAEPHEGGGLVVTVVFPGAV